MTRLVQANVGVYIANQMYSGTSEQQSGSESGSSRFLNSFSPV